MRVNTLLVQTPESAALLRSHLIRRHSSAADDSEHEDDQDDARGQEPHVSTVSATSVETRPT
jgi:hypothetical protein